MAKYVTISIKTLIATSLFSYCAISALINRRHVSVNEILNASTSFCLQIMLLQNALLLMNKFLAKIRVNKMKSLHIYILNIYLCLYWNESIHSPFDFFFVCLLQGLIMLSLTHIYHKVL